MNENFITTELKKRGFPHSRIRYRWLGDAGPGIHIVGTSFYALLPIDDESEVAFVDFVCAEVKKEKLPFRITPAAHTY